MSKATSDQAGRSLEYIIVKRIQDNYDVQLTSRSITDQVRDKVKFDTLPADQKAYYLKATEKILDIAKSKIGADLNGAVIDRLSDAESRKGDVTDIRITKNGGNLNLSLKHNHQAVKHQRPGSTPQQLGYSTSSMERNVFKSSYSDITSSFIKESKKLKESATLFDELKQIDRNFINEKLYLPICTLVAEFINQHSNRAGQYFSFLVGTINFTKVIVYNNSIKVVDFADVPIPTSMSAEVRNQSYIDLTFSNGWVISMRLHSASSRFARCDMKFDSQLVSESVPTKSINY